MSTIIDSIHTACTAQCTVDSPLGPVLLARTAKGLAGAWFEGQKHHPGALTAPVQADDPLLKAAAAQLRRYFAGEAVAFDLPLDLLGTAFQKSVWQALLAIPLGSTSSYGDIARGVTAASAVRAVGGAVGRNPVSVIVPCHRVIGTNGSLTGYAGGMDRKLALLELEGALGMRALGVSHSAA
ncbi:MAG: methylated-DNA--[protein]-cysteine S-methyltransferase [Burkholderiaceae bacterium]